MTAGHDNQGGRVIATHAIKYLLTAAIVGGAIFLLHRYIARMAWHDVLAAIERIPRWHVVGSILATLVSWACLTAYDVFAVETVVPGKVSMRMKIFSGVTTHAVCNALGFHAITGTALRYRMLSTQGVSAPDVARVVGLVGFAVGMGFAGVTAIALMLEPAIAHGWGRWLGMGLIILFVLLLRSCWRSVSAARRDASPELAHLAEGIEVSLLAFSVAAFFHPAAYHFYFYFVAGLAVAARVVSDRRGPVDA